MRGSNWLSPSLVESLLFGPTAGVNWAERRKALLLVLYWEFMALLYEGSRLSGSFRDLLTLVRGEVTCSFILKGVELGRSNMKKIENDKEFTQIWDPNQQLGEPPWGHSFKEFFCVVDPKSKDKVIIYPFSLESTKRTLLSIIVQFFPPSENFASRIPACLERRKQSHP